MKQNGNISITPVVLIVILAIMLFLVLPSSLSVFIDLCLAIGLVGGIILVRKGMIEFRNLTIFTSLIIGFVAALLADSRSDEVFSYFVRNDFLGIDTNLFLDRLASYFIATILSATIITGVAFEIKWAMERKMEKTDADSSEASTDISTELDKSIPEEKTKPEE